MIERIKNYLTVPYNRENYKRFSADFLKNMEGVPLKNLMIFLPNLKK